MMSSTRKRSLLHVLVLVLLLAACCCHGSAVISSYSDDELHMVLEPAFLLEDASTGHSPTILLHFDSLLEEEKEEEDPFANWLPLLQPEPAASAASSSASSRRQLQSSSATDTERVNVLQKLGESVGRAVVGCLLICFVPFFIWKNEGRHARELSRIAFCKNEAVAVDCQAPSNDETIGRLVHFVGTVSMGDPSSLSSLQFDPKSTGASLNTTRGVPRALILKRTCYIYQKFEEVSRQVQQDRLGGGETRTTNYTLKEDWTPVGPVQPPTLPHLPDHTNSRGIWDQLVTVAGASANGGASPIPLDQMPPEIAMKLGLYDANQAPHGLKVSPTARVGEFGLTRDVIAQNPTVFMDPAEQHLKPVPNTFLPDQFPDCPQLKKGSDHILRTFPENESPQNGDVKVVFEFAVDGFDASFVVAQVLLGTSPTIEEPIAADQDDELDAAEKATTTKYRVDQAEVTSKCCSGGDMGTIWMVRRGRHDLAEMIDMAKVDASNTMKILRILCWIGLCAGWAMVRTAPLVGLVCCLTHQFTHLLMHSSFHNFSSSCFLLLLQPCLSCPSWEVLEMPPSLLSP
jgi:hypothetical protein